MKFTLFYAVLLLLLVSCGSNPPMDVTLDDLSAGEYDEDSIRVTGIIGLNNVIYGDDPSFVLYTGSGANRVSCTIQPGENKNQMRPLPSEFVPEDVFITDENGAIIRYGDKVKVTGYVTTQGESEYVHVASIVKQ